MAKPDLFGQGDEDGDDDGDGEEGDGYVIIQLMPAQGWTAVFDDPTGGPSRTLGVTSFALVEILQPDQTQPPVRLVRPMVADEHGEVEDVGFSEDFVCLVPPGGDAEQMHAYVYDAREQERRQTVERLPGKDPRRTSK